MFAIHQMSKKWVKNTTNIKKADCVKSTINHFLYYHKKKKKAMLIIKNTKYYKKYRRESTEATNVSAKTLQKAEKIVFLS